MKKVDMDEWIYCRCQRRKWPRKELDEYRVCIPCFRERVHAAACKTLNEAIGEEHYR